MDSNFRTLEITVISCEDLRIDHRSVKKNAFVVVRTDPTNAVATKIDTEGGSYPFWDEKVVINMPLRERFLTLEVYRKKNGTAASENSRLIGSARMLGSDFMGGYLPGDYLSFLSYRLISPQGKRNGIINVSVRAKLSDNYMSASSSKKKMKEVAADAMAYEKPKPTLAVVPKAKAEADEDFGGFVTGVPVWGANLGQFASSSQ